MELISQERIRQRTLQEIMVVRVPSIWEQTVEVECSQNNVAERKSSMAADQEVAARRAEDLAAICETIKLLNDDDALELCRVTLLSRQMENNTFFWNAARNMGLPESMLKDGTDTLTEWQTLLV